MFGYYFYDGNNFLQIANDPRDSVRYRETRIFLSSANVGRRIGTQSIVKKVVVHVDTAYTAGVNIDIRTSTGTIIVPSASINPQVTGAYITEFTNNSTIIGVDDQIVAFVDGVVPLTGEALITVTFHQPY